MAIEAARLTAVVDADTDKAEKDIGGFGSSLGSMFGGAAKMAVAATAGIGVAAGAMAVAGIKAASDLSENQNKVNVVFGESAAAINAFAADAAQSFGISESAALGATGTFGNLLVSMGLGAPAAADMSTGILSLAADLGSFNNMGTEEVLEKIRAGLVGETEPLRALGVNLSAATIQSKALAMGLAGTAEELTPAMKAQAAYALMLEQTTTAQGDFARTKDGMANSLKIIKASFSDLQAEIGGRLLPLVAPLISSFAARLPGAIDTAGAAMDGLMGFLQPIIDAIGALAEVAGVSLTGDLQGMASAFQRLPGFLQPVAVILRTLVSGWVAVGKAVLDGDWMGALRAYGTMLKGLGEDLLGLAGTLLPKVWDLLAGIDWGGLLSGAAGIGADLLAFVWGELSGVDWAGLAGDVIDLLMGGLSAGADLAGDAWGWLTDAVSEIDWGAVGGTIVDLLLAGLTGVADVGARLLTWLSGAVTGVDWSGLATTIVDGVMVGISAVADFGMRFYTWASGQLSAVDWGGLGSTIMTGLTAGLQAAGGAGGDAGGGLVSMLGLDGIGAAISGLMPIIQPFVNIWRDQFMASVQAFQPVLAALQPLWEQLKTSFTTLQPTLTVVAGILGGVLLLAITSFFAQVRLLAEFLAAGMVAAITVATAAIQSLTGVIQTIQAVVQGVINIVRALLEGDFAGAWEAAKTMVSGVVDGIGQVFGGLPQLVLDIIIGLARSFLETLGGLASDAAGAAGSVLSSITGALSGLPGLVLAIVVDMAGQAIGAVGTFAADAATGAGTVLSNITGALVSLPGDVLAFFTDMAQQVGESLGTLAQNMITYGSQLLNGLIEGVKSVFSRAVSSVTDIKDEILGFFGDAASWLSSHGEAILQGLIDGISGLKDWAIGQIKGLAGDIKDGAVDAFKGAFGIGSPSRVMAELIGQPIPAGIVQGVQEGTPAAVSAITGLADLIAASVTDYGSPAISEALRGWVSVVATEGDVLNDWLTHLPDQWRDSFVAIGEQIAALSEPTTDAFKNYVTAIQMDGDYLNDWLTHLPEEMRPSLRAIGELISTAGYETQAAFQSYIEGVMVDGDTLNDWLTHLPEEMRGPAQEFANVLAAGLPTAAIDFQNYISAVMAGGGVLNDWLALLPEELRANAEAAGQAIVDGMAASQQGIMDTWMGLLGDLEGILTGDVQARLTESLNGLQKQLTTALAVGAPQEVIDALRANMAAIEAELARAGQLAAEAAAAGVQSEASKAAAAEAAKVLNATTLAELRKLLPRMEDGGLQLVDQLVAGMVGGGIQLEDAMGFLHGIVDTGFGEIEGGTKEAVQGVIDELLRMEKALVVDLANALVTGSDTAGIEANLAALEQMLKGLQAELKATEEAATEVLNPLDKLPGMGGGGSGGGGGGFGGGGGSKKGWIAPGATGPGAGPGMGTTTASPTPTGGGAAASSSGSGAGGGGKPQPVIVQLVLPDGSVLAEAFLDSLTEAQRVEMGLV